MCVNTARLTAGHNCFLVRANSPATASVAVPDLVAGIRYENSSLSPRCVCHAHLDFWVCAVNRKVCKVQAEKASNMH